MTQEQLIAFYLDWVNNFITTESMADHYALLDGTVKGLIEIGRKEHEDSVREGWGVAI